MNWQTPIIVCVASLALLGWQAPDCAPPVPPNKSVPVKEIEPGNYRVRLIATHGSKTGSAVTGSLWLRRTGAGDVSPTTGDKPPREEDRRRIPLYGALEAPLELVGAPIDHSGKSAPHPRSGDPIRPGVLVHIIDWDTRYPKGTPVLTVGSLSNLRTGELGTDGPGIAMWVHAVDDAGFSGRWGEWGLLVDGRGYFCADR
jgi:hypothetical protein